MNYSMVYVLREYFDRKLIEAKLTHLKLDVTAHIGNQVLFHLFFNKALLGKWIIDASLPKDKIVKRVRDIWMDIEKVTKEGNVEATNKTPEGDHASISK